VISPAKAVAATLPASAETSESRFTLSPNLIDWTPPKLFYAAQVNWNYKCGDPAPIEYPSLIDPASTSRNFDTIGNTAYLYFTQFHPNGCSLDLDRDLVRVAVSIQPAQ
jgi:hypothetical protein